MPDPCTTDYFQPHAEPASLFGNDVEHLPEPRVELPGKKITRSAAEIEAKALPAAIEALKERFRRRRAAMRAHGDWFEGLTPANE